jgi:aryl-alcohol dehydrogenase-like predicted oxidoreductase
LPAIGIAKAAGETIRAKTDDFAQKLYYRPSDFTVVDRLTEIATKRGIQNSQVALAWILGKPGVSAPIIGASKMTHLDQAIDALKVHLDDSEVKALEEPYDPHPVLGF